MQAGDDALSVADGSLAGSSNVDGQNNSIFQDDVGQWTDLSGRGQREPPCSFDHELKGLTITRWKMVRTAQCMSYWCTSSADTQEAIIRPPSWEIPPGNVFVMRILVMNHP